MKRISTIIIALFAVSTASAWSEFGHKTIVEIAKRHLTERTKQNIAKYMPYDITTEAVWMDEHRHDANIAFAFSWHVYNTDKYRKYDPNPRLHKGDAIHALKIADYNLSRYEELSDSTVVMNLRMVLHFAGDMHCPSHSYVPAPRYVWPCELNGVPYKSFHSFYDVTPNLLHPDMSPMALAALLDNASKGQRKKICRGAHYEWAQDCAKNNCKIFEWNEPLAEKLNPNTVELSRELVDRQLRNAGYRLAALLNRYFGK